jgi:hypothetical protein
LGVSALAEPLAAGLAREPSRRIGVEEMRSRLVDIGKERLSDTTWPIRP